ncbi:MAG: hypothetical protein M1825_000002 [Sarcosagium campestre]|nr:MAG: hypothetical protein M1825_000002 [Sarcosagium campestre]
MDFYSSIRREFEKASADLLDLVKTGTKEARADVEALRKGASQHRNEMEALHMSVKSEMGSIATKQMEDSRRQERLAETIYASLKGIHDNEVTAIAESMESLHKNMVSSNDMSEKLSERHLVLDTKVNQITHVMDKVIDKGSIIEFQYDTNIKEAEAMFASLNQNIAFTNSLVMRVGDSVTKLQLAVDNATVTINEMVSLSLLGGRLGQWISVVMIFGFVFMIHKKLFVILFLGIFGSVGIMRFGSPELLKDSETLAKTIGGVLLYATPTKEDLITAGSLSVVLLLIILFGYYGGFWHFLELKLRSRPAAVNTRLVKRRRLVPTHRPSEKSLVELAVQSV